MGNELAFEVYMNGVNYLKDNFANCDEYTPVKKILEELQKNASMPLSELSKKVGLSNTPCWNRIKKLEEDKVIISKTVILDNKKKEFARGLSSFSSKEINLIMGCHSNEIQKILGYVSKSEVVHKDDMVEI